MDRLGKGQNILMLEVDPFLALICKPEEKQIGDKVVFEGIEYTVVKRVPRSDGTVQCWFGREV